MTHTEVPPVRRILALAVFIALSAAALAVGGWLTTAGRGDGWYDSLKKPPFQPPDWAFAPAWIAIMTLTAVATWRVFVRPGTPPTRRRTALGLYAAQLLLNVGWTWLFFYAHRPRAAFAEIILFDLLLAAMIAAYARIDRAAALLLAPYLAWLFFATTLNGWIVCSN